MKGSLSERVWAKIEVLGPDDCWPWVGGVSGDGRGYVHADGKVRKATRVMWKLNHGEYPPAELGVLHTCDNGLCMNGAHHFLGTQKDNMEDCAAKGRVKVPDNRGALHWNSKITARKAALIRALYAPPRVTSRQLGALFGLHPDTVGNILRGRSWR